MLPQHLIVQFWEDVRKSLLEEHQVEEESASKAIADYRSRMDAHQVGDILYHRDPESVADTIAGGIRRGGFVEPHSEGAGR